MCGRYSIFRLRGFAERYGVELPDADGDGERDDSFRPQYNAAPGQHLPVVTNVEPGTVTGAKWGFVPSWADDDSGHINARAETVHEKPSFREAYESRRCLVPADGFYEWARTERGKRPFRVTFDGGERGSSGGEPFAMAGVWETWTPETAQAGLGDFAGGGQGDGGDAGRPVDPEPVRTFAVLTTEPNEVVAGLHDRMSVVLDPGDARRWLDGDLPRESLLEPYPAERTRAYEVSTAVNDASNDHPGLVEPVADGA
jgi:putative SOS response-associated peptidase YedK